MAPYVAAYAEDPDLGRLTGMEDDPDEEWVRRRFERELAIADPATDELLGSILHHSHDERHRRFEIGFWLAPRARGRGAATHAVALVMAWGFETLDLLRVEMTTTSDNAGVERLAARLGFTREGVLRKRNVERGRRVDIVWFGLLREEWEARQSR